VAWWVQKWGRGPKLVQGWAWTPFVAVASLVFFAVTKLAATTLWAAVVLACFGAFRERVRFHRALSFRDGWIHQGLFLLAGGLGVVGLVAGSPPALVLGSLAPRMAGLASSGPGLVQAALLVASLSLGVALVRAYVERTEPVVEALHHLALSGGRAAVAFAALSLLATPACIAWDGALESGMAQSGPVGL
jgi:hypothetical protein